MLEEAAVAAVRLFYLPIICRRLFQGNGKGVICANRALLSTVSYNEGKMYRELPMGNAWYVC